MGICSSQLIKWVGDVGDCADVPAGMVRAVEVKTGNKWSTFVDGRRVKDARRIIERFEGELKDYEDRLEADPKGPMDGYPNTGTMGIVGLIPVKGVKELRVYESGTQALRKEKNGKWKTVDVFWMGKPFQIRIEKELD